MGDILAFPAPAADSSAPPRRSAPAAFAFQGGRRGTYALGDIARALGLLDYTTKTGIGKLRILARERGMPLPLNPRIVAGRVAEGPSAIHARSRWDASAFDAWLDGRGPNAPAATPAAPRAERANDALRAAMRANAERLMGVGL